MPNNTTRPDCVIDAQPVLVVWIISWAKHILVALVVRFLVDHPEPSQDLDGVAAADVRVQITEVAVNLMISTLEVSVLVEDDLKQNHWVKPMTLKCIHILYYYTLPFPLLLLISFLCLIKYYTCYLQYSFYTELEQ